MQNCKKANCYTFSNSILGITTIVILMVIINVMTIYLYRFNLPLMIKQRIVNTTCKFSPIRCKPSDMAVWNNFVRVLDFLQVFKRTGSLFWSLLALAIGVYQISISFIHEKTYMNPTMFVLTVTQRSVLITLNVLIPQVGYRDTVSHR